MNPLDGLVSTILTMVVLALVAGAAMGAAVMWAIQ